MTVQWGVLSQRSGWPLSPLTVLDAWWRIFSAASDAAGTAAAASLPIAQSQQGLAMSTDQERAQLLLLNDQSMSSSSREANEDPLFQQSGLILPVAAQPLADEFERREQDRGAMASPCQDVGQEACTADVSSRYVVCPESAPPEQQGDRCNADGAVRAKSSGASLHASVLECSMQEISHTRPFTVRDIVSEWFESGHEAVNLR